MLNKLLFSLVLSMFRGLLHVAYGRGNLLWTTLPPIDMPRDKADRRGKGRKGEEKRGTTTALIMRRVFAPRHGIFFLAD